MGSPWLERDESMIGGRFGRAMDVALKMRSQPDWTYCAIRAARSRAVMQIKEETLKVTVQERRSGRWWARAKKYPIKPSIPRRIYVPVLLVS